ncbi:hypothetical protein BsWGS_19134 [Bradybaena similaris]
MVMPRTISVLCLAFFVNHSLAYMFARESEVVHPTESCLKQTRKCALDLRYHNCSEVIDKEINCTMRTICTKREFTYMHGQACRGEQLLTNLRNQLDPVCVKKLESPECDVGVGRLTIFDYGNLTMLYHLCDRVKENPVAMCIAGTAGFDIADCTRPQYASILNIVCAATGRASSTRKPDVRLLVILLLWTCFFMMASVSMRMSSLSAAECKIHGVSH